MANPPRDILFIPSGSIGDAVMMLALCVELEKRQPGITCTIIARRNAQLIADFAANYPFISVIAIERSIGGLGMLVWYAFRRPYTAFMPATFGKSWLFNTEQLFRLLSLRPGTRTFGLLKNEGDTNPYTQGLVYDPALRHFDNMRRLARAAHFAVGEERSPVQLSFRTLLPQGFPYLRGAYIVLHPFGSSSHKSFPPRRCRELLGKLGEQYPEYSFVVTGGAENTEQALQIVEGVPRATTALGLPILEAAGIIEGAALFIGVDTGTMHLACVMEQKVIALEHNASPEWDPSYNPNAVVLTNKEHCTCGGVKNDTCQVREEGVPYMRCLYEIADATILKTVKDVLARKRKVLG